MFCNANAALSRAVEFVGQGSAAAVSELHEFSEEERQEA